MLDPEFIVAVSILYLGVSALFLVAGKLGRLDFRPAKWRILITAFLFAGTLGVPYVSNLVEATSRTDEKEEIQAFFGAVQGLSFIGGMLLAIWAACGVRRDPGEEGKAEADDRE